MFRCSNLNGGFSYKLYGKIDNYIESLVIIIPVYYLLLDTLNVQCWLILFILNTCKQVLWQAVNTQTAVHQCLLCLLRKINNLQVQIYINLKTVNRFKYKMDYSLVVLSMCVQKSTRIKGVKDRRHFLRKMPPNLTLFGRQMAKIWL